MQTVQTPQKPSRWQRWGRILFLGLFLTLIQAVLFAWVWSGLLGGVWPLGGPVLLVEALSLFFFLLIPGVEAFITAWEDGNPRAAIERGSLVGRINFLCFVISIIVWTTVLMLPVLLGYSTGRFLGLFLLAMGILFAYEALGSLGVGLLGSWIGKRLGQ